MPNTAGLPCRASLPAAVDGGTVPGNDLRGDGDLKEVVILHNPRCSKSRATLALLTERGIKPVVLDYLANPPSPAELERIIGMLGLCPRELMRQQEAEYLALGLDNEQLGRAELLAAMCKHPRLIERPIVIANGRAAIGRPPESVLDIL